MTEKITLKPGTKLLFTGDSITDCGRSILHPLGTGYVSNIAQSLKKNYPDLNISIKNTGISGNTTRDLLRRFQKDCIDHHPDVLSILIGINDLWLSHGTELDMTTAVYPDDFESNYRLMLTTLKENSNTKTILIEPFMFTNNTDNPMFAGLKDYRNIVRLLADEFGTARIELQSMINDTLLRVSPEKFSDDFVHPSLWAHQWIAKHWLDAVEVTV